MRLLERIESTKKLWSMVCPGIDLPSDTWIAKWCTDHPDSIIEAGVTRVGQKFASDSVVDGTRAHRYATSVFRNIDERSTVEVQQHSSKQHKSNKGEK